MPESAGLELSRLPAQVLLFRFADLEGAVPEELRVPLRNAKLPRHGGAAEFSSPFVPAAIHRPVPGKGRAVFTGEHWFDALGRPVLEPVGEFLNRDEIRVEIDGVHRAQVPRSMMINNAARVQAPQNRF